MAIYLFNFIICVYMCVHVGAHIQGWEWVVYMEWHACGGHKAVFVLLILFLQLVETTCYCFSHTACSRLVFLTASRQPFHLCLLSCLRSVVITDANFCFCGLVVKWVLDTELGSSLLCCMGFYPITHLDSPFCFLILDYFIINGVYLKLLAWWGGRVGSGSMDNLPIAICQIK